MAPSWRGAGRRSISVADEARKCSDAETLAAAESVRPAGDDEWAALLAQSRRSQPVGSTADDLALTQRNRTRCPVRDEWLHAAGQDAAAQKPSDRIARDRAAGVAPNGDIFIVVARLISAKRSRAAAVRTHPCNEQRHSRTLRPFGWRSLSGAWWRANGDRSTRAMFRLRRAGVDGGCLFVAFALFAAGFWAYFRFRQPRQVLVPAGAGPVRSWARASNRR